MARVQLGDGWSVVFQAGTRSFFGSVIGPDFKSCDLEACSKKSIVAKARRIKDSTGKPVTRKRRR